MRSLAIFAAGTATGALAIAGRIAYLASTEGPDGIAQRVADAMFDLGACPPKIPAGTTPGEV
jgi:hypothetical protein